MAAPVDPADLTSPEGRERALDRLGVWFVEGLLATGDDRAAAAAHLRDAITAFYDIRESADQLRCMYAGHFFMVDAVGLDHTDRPVPWHELARRVDPARLEHYKTLFDAAEREAR